MRHYAPYSGLPGTRARIHHEDLGYHPAINAYVSRFEVDGREIWVEVPGDAVERSRDDGCSVRFVADCTALAMINIDLAQIEKH